MVRHRLPSSSYYTPNGESEWLRETLCERPIAVLPEAYRNPIEMARHVAEHVSSPQPFFVMDVAAVQRRIDALQVLCPRICTSYSVGMNADPVLARIIANNEDTVFEVSNLCEAEMASVHVENERIVMCSPILTRRTIKSVGEFGIGTIVIESEKQLQEVLAKAPGAEILIAVQLAETHSPVPFGCHVDKVGELVELAELLGANLTGIYTDFATDSLSDYVHSLRLLKNIFDDAAKCRVDFTRIAFGNFEIPTKGEIMTEEFVMFCSTINKTINELFPKYVTISANVGKFLVTNAFTLCTTVIAKREMNAKYITDQGDDSVGFVYQTNDGFYGSFGCRQMNIDPLCKPLHPSDDDNEEQHFGTILGPTLDQMDVAQKVMRSRQLRVGEWLVWEKMGAFTIPVDSEHPVPPVYYYTGRDFWKRLSTKDECRRSTSPIDEDLGSEYDGYMSSCDDADSLSGIFDFSGELF